jgi:S-formylglutathione hydrolase FrmB
MKFLVILPAGVTLTNAPVPVVYFLHGRGRNERTLLETPPRDHIMAFPYALVLPRAHNSWYVNSEIDSKARYADYIDEVITLAEKHFPVMCEAKGRAIGGWSMGGYGSLFTACRRSGDFIAAASIIGIVDYPRPDIPEKGQNYAVAPCFGTDTNVWVGFNPRRQMDRLKRTHLFIAYADKAAERQMNEVFLADARRVGIRVEALRLSGGHTFPTVEEALPSALRFLNNVLSKSAAQN